LRIRGDAVSETKKIEVYTILGCPYCQKAKELLDQLKISYDERDLTTNPDRRAFTSKILPGHTSVPLVIINGKPIGGFSELKELHAKGQLEPMVFGEEN
jgi:glutaredoxin 3